MPIILDIDNDAQFKRYNMFLFPCQRPAQTTALRDGYVGELAFALEPSLVDLFE